MYVFSQGSWQVFLEEGKTLAVRERGEIVWKKKEEQLLILQYYTYVLNIHI